MVQSCVHIHSIGLTFYNQYRSPGSCTPSPVCLSVRSSVAGPSPDGRSGSSALVPPASHDEGRREMGLWGAGSSFNKWPIPNSSQNNSNINTKNILSTNQVIMSFITRINIPGTFTNIKNVNLCNYMDYILSSFLICL